MVATRSDSVDEARQLGAKIKREVNKRYKWVGMEGEKGEWKRDGRSGPGAL